MEQQAGVRSASVNTQESDTLVQKTKPLLAIMCCNHRQSYADAQRETWISDINGLIDYKFFFGKGIKRDPLFDEVFLDCEDGYRSLPMKVKLAVEWAYNHGYDYVAKSDDDVYIRPERLITSGYDKYPYSGFSFQDYGAVGLLYWLNRDCMKLVMQDMPAIEQEDSWIAQLMQRNKVQFHHDNRYRLILTDKIGRMRSTPGMPEASNDMIAVAEFPGQTMHTPHNHWKESIKEYEELLGQIKI